MSKIGLVGGLKNHLDSSLVKGKEPQIKKGEFDQLLKAKDSLKQQNIEKNSEVLKFSSHAVERMKTRGVRFSAQEMEQISNAALKAKNKGSKESLLLTDKAALIVDLKNNKVITVMDKEAMRENVFTNIDSTILV